MKKFGKVFTASALAAVMAVTPVYAAPTVDELEKEKAAVENQVSSLQSELTSLLSKITELENNLIEKGQQIAQATEDLAAAEEREIQQYEDMKLRIKYMYEAGEASIVETLCAAEDFSDFLNKAEYVQNVNTYDREMLDAYVETKEEVKTLKAGLEEDLAQMETMQAEYQQEESTLNETIQSKQNEIANFDAEIQAAAEAAAKAAAEEAAKRAAEQEAANSAAQAGNSDSGTNGNSNNGNADNGSTSNGNTNNSANNTNSNSNNSNSNTNSNPGGNTSTASVIVSAAYGYIGVPYVWGGASRSGVDCSGLVMLAHRAAGIGLSHSSGAQGGGGKAVSNPQPGDVVCYAGHVGIYIGGGQMIHAPQPGQSVKVQSVYGNPWYRRYW